MAETVTVACKLPHGLILRVFDMIEGQEPVLGGGSRKVKVARELPQSVTIHGNSHPHDGAPKTRLAGGYALTYNVDKAFFERWLKENADSDVVRNNLIFCATSEANAAAQAEEQKDIRSGFERLSPDKLPGGLKKDTAAV